MALTCNGGEKFVEKGTFVKKGTTIIEAEPFVAILSSKFRKENCDACFKSCKISRCSGCQFVHYCSRNCQRQSWVMHKIECPNMKRVHPREVPDAARMMTHIIIKLQSGKDVERGYYSSYEYKTFNDLMSHYCNIKQDMIRMEHFTSLSAILYDFLPHSMLPEPKKLLEIYGRVCTNSFEILDIRMVGIGVGVYLGPSIIDHSCKPNAVTVFDGKTLIVRSLQDIPSFDWTKVSITYIDLLISADERRKRLEDSYYFSCDCDRCNNPDIVATAAACPNKICTNPCFPNDSKCGKCGQEFPAGFKDQFEMTSSYSLRQLEKMKKSPLLDVCRMCLRRQEGLLHPLNTLYVRMLEMASAAANEQELWEETEIYSRKLIQKYEYYFGNSHPLTGHIYLMLGKVLGFGKKPNQAFNVLKKTLDIVKVAFGDNHPMVNEVKEAAKLIIVQYSD